MTDHQTMRGLLTATALHTWFGDTLHSAFQRDHGIDGVRLRLRYDSVQVNDETAAFPEHFPWIFGGIADSDVVVRRCIVEHWLRHNPHLVGLYPSHFKVEWYS